MRESCNFSKQKNRVQPGSNDLKLIQADLNKDKMSEECGVFGIF